MNPDLNLTPEDRQELLDAYYWYEEGEARMTTKNLLQEAMKLSEDERVKLAEGIWQSVENGWLDARMPDWHKRELDRRIQAHRENPREVVTWEEVQKQMTRRQRLVRAKK